MRCSLWCGWPKTCCHLWQLLYSCQTLTPSGAQLLMLELPCALMRLDCCHWFITCCPSKAPCCHLAVVLHAGHNESPCQAVLRHWGKCIHEVDDAGCVRKYLHTLGQQKSGGRWANSRGNPWPQVMVLYKGYNYRCWPWNLILNAFLKAI